jgi:hypothetical protein
LLKITFKTNKMKFENRFKIILNILFIWVLCVAISITIPLQLIDFIINGKNRIWKYFENIIFKTLFINDDLRKNI